MAPTALTRRQLLLGMGSLSLWGFANAARKKDRVDVAMENGANFLLSMQQKEGAFVRSGRADAMTSLGIMALASMGHQSTDPGKFGLSMQKAMDFILRREEKRLWRGQKMIYFGSDGSRMYGHGITTLCLAEMLGMSVGKTQEVRLREVLKKAVELILFSQRVRKGNASHRGGWRYSPLSSDSDLSITVWQLMALRSAKGAGMDVPKEAIEMAVRYLKRSYYSPRNARGEPTNLRSGCGYMPGKPPSLAMAAAGLLSLQVCGEYDSLEARGSVNWLREQNIGKNRSYFYYGTYYYSQGMRKREKAVAEKARQMVEDALLKRQEGGTWKGGHGPVYCTSMAMLSLSVKYHYLPIYQH